MCEDFFGVYFIAYFLFVDLVKKGMARDKFHQEVRLALENEGWVITDDPLLFKVGKIQIQIDLGAEQLIAAERGTEKIAVEIKSFTHPSFITALYEAIGKYILYRSVLKVRAPERILFLAVPEIAFNRFFQESVIQNMMREEGFKIVLYDQYTKTITKWII